MNIKELEPRQGNVDVIAEVMEKEPVREFEKFGKSGKVCNATVKDESGKIKLTLWNEQSDQINVGDKIQITNGYVNEWQGEKQLTSGKFGKLEVLEKGASVEKEETKEEKVADKSNPEPEEPITEDEILDNDSVEEEKLEKSE